MGQDGVMTQPSNFSMYGAVDLGARAAAAKRREQTAAAGNEADGGSSEFVIEVTDATFSADVVARSRSVPVILDLWAEWCGPCKQLSPVLERLAAEAAGSWVLAKVDVDANPQLSAALQVQSIPMVVAVIGGQIVDGFLGALPEPQVREWIGQILQVAEQLGMPSGQEPGTPAGEALTQGQADAGEQPDQASAAGPARAGTARNGVAGHGAARPDPLLADPRLGRARDAMDSGDLGGAANALEQVLADTPGHPVAKAWMAQVELLRRVGSYDADKVRRVAQENPDDAAAQAKAADLELVTGQIDESFARLLGVIQRTSGAERDAARLHLIGLFDMLSPRDPRVTRARARLSSLLF
jgi:putative thioredoxin